MDEYLRNPDCRNMFALGACVAQPAVESTTVRVGAPDSMYSISEAGEIVPQNILAQISDTPLVSYLSQRAKWLTDMGTTGASYLSEPQVPLRDINWMRQARWVHHAKVDFEKDYVNTIRLQPAGQAPSAAPSIAAVMSRVLVETSTPPAPNPVRASAGKPLEIRLPQDPCIELRALVKSLEPEPDALGSELLAAAVAEAKSYLNEAGVDALERARRELLVAELPERQPGVEFHGGGT